MRQALQESDKDLQINILRERKEENNEKTVTLLVLISMLFSTVFLFTGCGDSSVKEIKTADDIKGASVGVQTGTTGDTFVSDYEADGTKVMRYSKGADAIVALTQNKIDCVVIDSEPAKEFVKANAGLKILDEPFAEEQYAICISKEIMNSPKNRQSSCRA